MKTIVVRGMLPAGVAIEGVSTEPWFSGLLKEFVPLEKKERRESTGALELGLEVPPGTERETAIALRNMADALWRE